MYLLRDKIAFHKVSYLETFRLENKWNLQVLHPEFWFWFEYTAVGAAYLLPVLVICSICLCLTPTSVVHLSLPGYWFNGKLPQQGAKQLRAHARAPRWLISDICMICYSWPYIKRYYIRPHDSTWYFMCVNLAIFRSVFRCHIARGSVWLFGVMVDPS
jgi:hypothetical protein